VDRLRHVRYLGYVPESDIAPLTAAATAFAYPSLYEGFGFPVVQAMAAGVPVVTSNVSSLPEVAGEAAILIDPRSQSELRGALSRVLTSADLRASMASSGRERAKRFRWTECASRSLKFFEKIADR
jgi:alpha-1,3-rhamnosyl/mannosyltransferase